MGIETATSTMVNNVRYTNMELKKLWAVETLDVRFGPKPGQHSLSTKAPKWKTKEFWIYYLAFLTIPVLMVKAVYNVSGPWHPTYPTYEHLLSPGWIPGRKVDNSDAQYRGFRENIPYMALLVMFHPLLKKLYLSTKGINQASSDKSPIAANARKQSRIQFDFAFALVFIIALHGFSSVKILLILYINFLIPTSLPRAYSPTVTWIFNISILFANELCQGYSMRSLVNLILPAPFGQGARLPVLYSLAAWLDSHGGLLPRWEVFFNITVLRLISFNFDYIWSQDHRAVSPIEKKNLDPANLSEIDRVRTPANRNDFTFRNYLAFVLYSPLYLAGPIINFNDYISQSSYQLLSINKQRLSMYALRFFICLLTMELVLHFLYTVAICNSKPDWNQYSPFQLSMLGYFNLHVIWLKLLLPFRFFRLWALLDGIDPPENMVRCVSDNYSTLAFWRGWHRSFNRWIVRYVYVPLGGSGDSKVRSGLNYLAVFTFVALWHDINLRLLAWGWLISLFVLPEVIATLLLPAKKWQDRPDLYRILCGIGAIGNVLMMMIANLVGFAVGIDGVMGIVEAILNTFSGKIFFLMACATLFIGIQMMFEIREAEKRRGINMKC